MATTDPTKFTERQIQVARLFAAGYTDQQIATDLGITPRTVKAHLDTLRHKLGVQRKKQIPYALRVIGVDILSGVPLSD